MLSLQEKQANELCLGPFVSTFHTAMMGNEQEFDFKTLQEAKMLGERKKEIAFVFVKLAWTHKQH